MAAEVATQTTAKSQAAMIDKFAEVARRCLAHHNFFSVFAILGALDFPDVRRLADAWALVSKQVRRLPTRGSVLAVTLFLLLLLLLLQAVKTVTQLQSTLLNPTRNMKVYREYLNRLDPASVPIVPFIPVALKVPTVRYNCYAAVLGLDRSFVFFFVFFLRWRWRWQDLYFTNENVESVDGVINFDKKRELARQAWALSDRGAPTYETTNPLMRADKGLQAYLAVAVLDK